VGLLDKTNPAATRESLIRNAWIFGGGTFAVGLAMCLWKQPANSGWPFVLALVSLAGAALGALLEWQMDDGISVELFYVVQEVNDEFGITIPEWDKIETVDDLHRATLMQLREREGAIVDEDDVWRRLKTLLVKQLAFKPEQVVPEAQFYIDLPM
jgi:hypothetical protein